MRKTDPALIPLQQLPPGAWAGVTDKTELANQCKTALEQAKTSFGAMGCTF